ncbi:MAG: flagellar export chaperone FliS [Nitrospiraceae bacterium]|nr:flagellar export chaperone FliS [Nitrospiraceae bacterium]
MISQQYASNAYMKSMVNTSVSRLDLVIMLYDGSIEFLMKAMFYMNQKDVGKKLLYMDKAMAIIEHLKATLNMEAGGEIAQNLHGLYSHMLVELTLANIRNDPEKIKRVEKLLRTLRDGWRGIKK